MIDISAAYLIREEIAAKSEYTYRLNIGRIVEPSRSRLEDSKSSTRTSWAFIDWHRTGELLVIVRGEHCGL